MRTLDAIQEDITKLHKEYGRAVFYRLVAPTLRRFGWVMYWGNGAVGFVTSEGADLDNRTIDRLFDKVDSAFDELPSRHSVCSGLWEAVNCIEPNDTVGSARAPAWNPAKQEPGKCD